MGASRVVVVTGGFGTLGKAVGITFAQSGYRTVLLGRASTPSGLTQEFPTPHQVLGGIDLTDPKSAEGAMAAVRQACGGIDVLVNVAGGFRSQSVEQGAIDTWDAMFDMNLKTAVVATRAALPQILQSQSGRIINIGAATALSPSPAGMGAYLAAKAGVHKFTESLAAELKDRGVTVNAILPSIIDTLQNRADMPEADFSRWVAPAAIAEVIVFLASAKAAAVTGALIPVRGSG